MHGRPGGRRQLGPVPARSAVLTLVIVSATALALLSAYVVVARVPPLPGEPSVVAVAASAPTAAVPAPQAAAVPVAPVQAVPQVPAPIPGVPRVVVIGDSFTTGPGGQTSGTWPERICERVGCQYLPQFASPRTGWTQPGADGLAVGGRLDAVVAAAPDVIVIAAGAFDGAAPGAVVRGSVNAMLYQLDRRLPTTPVIVLSPFWESAPAPPSVIEIRGWIYFATIKHADTFVNVTDLFDQAHPGLMQTNRAAPNQRGQAYIASIVEPFVRDAIPGGWDNYSG